MTIEQKLHEAVSGQVSAEYARNLEQAIEGCLRVMSRINEKRAPFVAGHEMQVAQLAAAIGKQMGLPNEVIQGIRVAGSIHDIGNISIPEQILCKPEKLTEYEMLLVRNHVQAGFDMMKDIDFPWPIAKIILQHHERLDGSGYPNGTKGGEIILESRIVAVADVVDAIASHRPYRPALGIQSALNEIAQGNGLVYDADVVKACLKIFHDEGYAREYASSGTSPG